MGQVPNIYFIKRYTTRIYAKLNMESLNHTCILYILIVLSWQYEYIKKIKEFVLVYTNTKREQAIVKPIIQNLKLRLIDKWYVGPGHYIKTPKMKLGVGL